MATKYEYTKIPPDAFEKLAVNTYKITVSTGRDAQDKQIRHFKTWKADRPMRAQQMEKEARRTALEFEREITLVF